jgi:hypothetical protein
MDSPLTVRPSPPVPSGSLRLHHVENVENKTSVTGTPARRRCFVVEQRECPRYVRLAQTGEPTGLGIGQVLCVTPHRLRE